MLVLEGTSHGGVELHREVVAEVSVFSRQVPRQSQEDFVGPEKGM